jgi:hypothetical protein
MTTAEPPTPEVLEAPKKPKGGAPKGSANALRHGLRGIRGPKADKDIDDRVFKYRRSLEDEELAASGCVSVEAAELIQTAYSALRHSWRCDRWLNRKFDQLDNEQRRQYSRDAIDALEVRNKAVAKLRARRSPEAGAMSRALSVIAAANGGRGANGDAVADSEAGAHATTPHNANGANTEASQIGGDCD